MKDMMNDPRLKVGFESNDIHDDFLKGKRSKVWDCSPIIHIQAITFFKKINKWWDKAHEKTSQGGIPQGLTTI